VRPPVPGGVLSSRYELLFWTSITFGCLLLLSLFTVGVEDRDVYFYMFSIAFSLVVLGGLGLEYTKRQYRGGVPAIIGTIFFFIGFAVYGIDTGAVFSRPGC
jgi:hypothetical protein